MGTVGGQGEDEAALLDVWLVDAQGSFVGAAPDPELAAAIAALALCVARSGAAERRDVGLGAAELGGQTRAVRLVARPAPGGAVAVASLALARTGDADAPAKAGDAPVRDVTSAIEHLFWLSNPEGNETLYVSPAYEKIWGRSCESVYRDTLSFVEAIHEDDRARIVARLPLQREGTYDETYRIRRPDGAVRWIRSRAYPIRDDRGEVVRVAGIAMDITAQRHLEEQLAQAQRLESVARLAGGIAHDFNNLLTVILASADLLLSRAPLEGAVNADLEAIKDAGERAATLTAQLLTFARRQAVAPARLDVRDVAHQMERLLRRVLGEHIELRTELEHESLPVIADRAQLEQVLVNLLINARDSMPNGGRVTIETRSVTVGVPGSDRALVRAESEDMEPGEYVLLAIADTGGGIPSDALPHLFEPFFTTKALGQGTGLGLATCYGIVQQAGGTILVDTELGVGTTFTILLPRATGRADLSRRSPPCAGASQGSETVLFVEDDPRVRRIGMRILTEHGYGVCVASDGREALQVMAAREDPIHLLVTDVVMPGMNGIELARKLHETHPELPVLFSSGYTDAAVISQNMLAPKTAFLRKPYKPEMLLAKVRELLDRVEG